MPKIFEDPRHSLTVFIYTNDHVPAHVHVFLGRKSSRNQPGIKINLGSEDQAPSLVTVDPSISNRDAIRALKLVAAHQELFLQEWNRIHGA
jgi:hypothetical protein